MVALRSFPATGSAASRVATTTRRPLRRATRRAGARRFRPACVLRPTRGSLPSTRKWRPEVKQGGGRARSRPRACELRRSDRPARPSGRGRRARGLPRLRPAFRRESLELPPPSSEHGRTSAMNPSGNQDMAKTIHLTEQTFDEALAAADGLVMVDFWAEWCGPCQAIAPVLEKIADGSDGRVTLMKVNVDENHSLAARYAIRSIPTILFVKDGMVVESVVGAAPRAVLEEIVNAQAS